MTKEVRIILATPADWTPWYEQLQRHASALSVWEYVDPDGHKELVVPKRPTFESALDEAFAELLREYEATQQRSQTVGNSQAAPESPQRPTRPLFLSADQKKILDEKREDWKLADREYTRTLASYNKVVESVNETVSSSWMALTPATGTLRAIVQELKRQVAPTITVELSGIRTEYREALQTSRSMKVDPWYQRWERARKMAAKHNLSEIAGTNAIEDFLDAVEVFLPDFTNYQKIRLIELSFSNSPLPSLESIGMYFQAAWRSHEAIKASKHAAFATATFQGRPADQLHDCPCGGAHPWDPKNCEYVQNVLFDVPFKKVKNAPKPKINACRKRLRRDPKWKKLVDDLKEGSTRENPKEHSKEHSKEHQEEDSSQEES